VTAFEDFVNLELPQRAAMLTASNTGVTGDPNTSTLAKVKRAPEGAWFIDALTGSLWQKLDQNDPLSWRQRASGSGSSFTCPTGVAAGDAVYISGVGTVAAAGAGGAPTKDAIGVVSYKPSSTVAVIVQFGFVGSYSSLTPGDPVFINPSVPGKITSALPSTLGHKVQKMGHAITISAILVNVEVSVTL